MKLFLRICLVLMLPACATLGRGSRAPATPPELWRQAHDAYSRDSFRVAEAMFQRVASEYPRTTEGHEARYYLGMLNLEPRSHVDLSAAEEHLGIYLAEDSLLPTRGYHLREAGTALRLVQQLRAPCGRRVADLACDTAVVSRTVTVPGDAPAAAGTAEAARLRRQLNERDATIRELRAELERIRNTLAPRTPSPE